MKNKENKNNKYKLAYITSLIVILIGAITLYIITDLLKPRTAGEVLEKLNLIEIVPESREEAVQILFEF